MCSFIILFDRRRFSKQRRVADVRDPQLASLVQAVNVQAPATSVFKAEPQTHVGWKQRRQRLLHNLRYDQ